jgi:peroxiredoxin
MTEHRPARRLQRGDTVGPQALTTITGDEAPLPDPHHLTHLQFRRFAGCPVCNLHLRSFVARHQEVAAAGVRELVVFHSTDDDLRRYEADLPFAVVGDPGKRLYHQFGVESGPRSLLDPRGWPTIVVAVARSLVAVVRGAPVPPLRPGGGRYGLPADLLVDRAGTVVAVHYGARVDDQWSVDEVLALARTAEVVEAADAVEAAPPAASEGGAAPGRRVSDAR